MNPDLNPISVPETAEVSPDTQREVVTEPPAAPEPEEAAVKTRRPRGFAAMDRSRVSEIASKGGKAAHAAGTAHQFNSDEAKVAGKKGGVAPHVRRGRGPRAVVSQTPPTSSGPRSKPA